MEMSHPPEEQVQFKFSQTNVGLALITFTIDSTISGFVIEKQSETLIFHNREYNRPPRLLG